MKSIVALAAIVLMLAAPLDSRAEMWCGKGPGTPLDHPCDPEESAADSAVTASVAKYEDPWTDIGGVWKVAAGTVQSGDPGEIRVYVEPAQMAEARQQIPSQVDGINVVLIPRKQPAEKGTAGFSAFGSFSTNDDEWDAEAEKSRLAQEAGAQVMDQYGQEWNDLPGVIGMGPAVCDEPECKPGAIAITVQAPLMQSVKERIPSTVNGVPVILLPYENGDN